MGRCCDKTCSSSSGDSTRHRWVRFPTDPAKKTAWVTAMGIDNWTPKPTAVLCDLHFSGDLWDPLSGRLKADAIPDLFCRCRVAEVSTPVVTRRPLGDLNGPVLPIRPRILKRPTSTQELLENTPPMITEGRPRKSVDKHSSSCPFLKHCRSSQVSAGSKQETLSSPCRPSVRDITGREVLIPSDNDSSTISSPLRPSLPDGAAEHEVPVPLDNHSSAVSFPPRPNPRDDVAAHEIPVPPNNYSNPASSPIQPTHREIVAVVGSADHSYALPFVLQPSNFDVEPESSTGNHPNEISPPIQLTQTQHDHEVRELLSLKSGESLHERCKRLESLAAKLCREKFKAQRTAGVCRSRFNRERQRRAALKNSLSRFGEDQLKALTLGTSRGSQWSSATIKLGWKLHFACGSTGYETVDECQMPLPSIRTLTDRMKHLKFHPGILHQLFDLLPPIVQTMSVNATDCVFVAEEMAIKPGFEFGPNLKEMIGKCTIPCQLPKITRALRAAYGTDPVKIQKARQELQEKSLTEKASKAVIVAYCSAVNARWKFIGGFEFIGKSVDGNAMKTKMIEYCRKIHSVGLFMRVVTSDMGNAAFFAACGIKGSKGVCVNIIAHPIVPEEKLFFMPDPVHVFKNSFIMLATHSRIFLPLDLVQAFHLPSRVVEFKDTVQLQDFQKKLRWRICPKLHSTDLVGGQFRKMFLWNAIAVLNPSTAAGLRFLSHIRGEPFFETTAWYVSFIFKWFKLKTSRTPLWALGKKNLQAYEDAVNHLELAIYHFENLYFGSDMGEWKPCQAGVKLSTKTVLNLKDLYMEERNHVMMFTGWLTQGLVENIHSRVRARRPVPSPRQFRETLRKLIVSMNQRKVRGSNYETDDRDDLIDFSQPLSPFNKDDTVVLESGLTLAEARRKHSIREGSAAPMNEEEKYGFYRVCGYGIFELFKEVPALKNCNQCCVAMTRHEQVPHQYGLFTGMSNYTTDKLVEVSDVVFRMLISTEEFILAEKAHFDVCNETELANIVDAVFRRHEEFIADFPTCHDAPILIFKRYLTMRLRLGLDVFFEAEETSIISSQLYSRTTAAQFLTNRVK